MDSSTIQENEVDALKAIYMDDFKMLARETVWNSLSAPQFTIKLRPTSQYKSAIELELKVSMTKTYPRTKPDISIIYSNDLHPKQLDRIRSDIDQTIKERLNEEMIFDVTSNIQDLLDEYARVSNESSSLDQVRAKRLEEENKAKLAEEQRKLREKQETEQKKKKEFDEMVVEELHNRETEQYHKMPEPIRLIPETTDIFTFDRPVNSRMHNGSTVSFQQVIYGMHSAFSQFGPTYLVTPILPKIYNDPWLPLALTQISLENMFWQSSEGRKQLQYLENEMYVCKEFRHPNVVPLYEYQIGKYKKPRSDESGLQIVILSQHWSMNSLADVIETVGTVSLKVAKSWSIQLLEGLDALHKNGIVHRYLSARMVVLNKSPHTSETSLLLLAPSYYYKLQQMNKHHPFGAKRQAICEAKWAPPELAEENAQPTRKTDIWQFGVLLTQALCGLDVVDKYESPAKLIKSVKCQWPESLCAFLQKIFEVFPRKRPTAIELLMDSFTRSDWDSDISLSLSHSVSTKPRSASTIERASGYSRYLNDFDEGAVLGKGGFGQVVKARNKLDGRVYAIKKIQATATTLTQILQEVVLLSRLDHQYVVRYYTAWLEEHDRGGTPEPEVAESVTEIDGTSTRGSEVADTESSQYDFDGNSTPRMSYSMSELDLFNTSAVSSSSGMIQFGDTDKESESEGELTPAPIHDENGSSHMDGVEQIARIPRPVLKSTLYIQMQYCENRTLRDLIKFELHNSPQEYWRLFRQIVEALAYIHGEGIIHRDLKPNNIFIDEANNVKIGDFGLARSVAQPSSTVLTSGNTGNESEDLTTEVGTSLYVAVETLNTNGSGNYNEKIDIYSLGIIWFQMVFPMGTEMEKMNIIRRLRSPEIEVPTQFMAKKFDQERKIVKELLNHNPMERPSARQLLDSGDIPSSTEELTLKDALKSIAENKSSIQQVCSALFSQPLDSAQQILYDRTIGRKRHKDEEVSSVSSLFKSDVISRLRSLFQVHGAVEENSFRSRIFPRSALYQSNTVCELLDPVGNVLQLPHDLTMPYARRLAERTPAFSKTFTLGTVFRQDPSNPGSHPRVANEVDFDILSHDLDIDPQFQDAEAIKVMADAVMAVPFVEHERLAIYINHCEILSEILDYCGFTPPQHYGALSLLGECGVGPARASARRELLVRSNISSSSLDVLVKMGFLENIENKESKLRTLLERHYVNRITPFLEYLKSVSALVRKFGVTVPIYFAPLSNYHSKFYEKGIMFQMIIEDEGRRSILAAGGRYDSLIEHFTNDLLDGRKCTTKAVGFNLALDKVLDYTSNTAGTEKIREIAVSHPRCHFLVTSFYYGNFRGLSIDVARQLWLNGISADIAPPFTSSEELMRYCRQENIPYAVIVKQTQSVAMSGGSFKPLKVKSVAGKDDLDFNIEEFVHFAMDETIPDGQKSSAIISNWEPEPEAARPSTAKPEQESDSKVVVLSEISKNKGRKGRWVLEDKCRETLQKYITDLSAAPIVCLDLKDEVVNAICQVSPFNEDEWRRRVASLNPGQKAYIMSVQSKLASEAGRAPTLILYSTKSDNIAVYHVSQFA